MTTMVATRTREAYDAIFETARRIEYPEVDAFEQRMGYAIDRERLESAARVLACPLKANPPHWQHGRVIYAAARNYISGGVASQRMTALDVGTAKGFSALCLRWAMQDSEAYSSFVASVDVIDPYARVERNTVAELDGVLTLSETLAQWPATSGMIQFAKSTGIEFLSAHSYRLNIAFIDGKHDAHVVRQEGKLLAKRQEQGDLAMFDDCQIPGVSQAVASLGEFYRLEYITAGPRQYAVGRRR